MGCHSSSVIMKYKMSWLDDCEQLYVCMMTYPIRHENGQLRNVDSAVVKIANSKFEFIQAPIIKNVMYLKIKSIIF